MSRPYDLTRVWGFGLVAALTIAGLAYASPDQLPVVTYKLGLVTSGGFVGYWLDRHLFPYARPHVFMAPSKLGAKDDPEFDRFASMFSLAMLRRAIIVAATVIGFAVAV